MSHFKKKGRLETGAKLGQLPPLFDRLTTDDLKMLDLQGVCQSIQREIETMLSIRQDVQPLPLIDIDGETTLHVLYPENKTWESLWEDPQDQTLWPAMEQHLQTYIATFEPRLKDPSVRIQGFDITHQALSLTIEGRVHLGAQVEVLSFPLVLHPNVEQGL